LADSTTLRTCCPVRLADFIKISERSTIITIITSHHHHDQDDVSTAEARTNGDVARRRRHTEVAGLLVFEDLDLRHLLLFCWFPRLQLHPNPTPNRG
jgi:hypothetical protein